MSLKLGDTAPDFEQDSTGGRLHFYDWAGDAWAVGPSIYDETARRLFPDGWNAAKPYLRTVKQPA